VGVWVKITSIDIGKNRKPCKSIFVGIKFVDKNDSQNASIHSNLTSHTISKIYLIYLSFIFKMMLQCVFLVYECIKISSKIHIVVTIAIYVRSDITVSRFCPKSNMSQIYFLQISSKTKWVLKLKLLQFIYILHRLTDRKYDSITWKQIEIFIEKK
jgi:hypothetical protein